MVNQIVCIKGKDFIVDTVNEQYISVKDGHVIDFADTTTCPVCENIITEFSTLQVRDEVHHLAYCEVCGYQERG